MESENYDEMDAAERQTLARTRLQPLIVRFGGEIDLRDEDCVLLRCEIPDSRRPFAICAYLNDEEVFGADGDVVFIVFLDNRVGRLEVSLEPADEELPEGRTPLRGELYISASDESDHPEMKRVAARLPAEFLPAAERFLREYERYKLDVAAPAIRSEISQLWFEAEDWDECVRELEGELRALDHLASLIERAGPGTDIVCTFCNGRFVLDPSRRCPNCGAAVD